MNEIQKIQYDMLIELDQVCRKHGLTYYLAYGTCLGAVRDKGFIAWDHDVDVLMPFKDSVELEKYQDEFSDNFFISSRRTDKTNKSIKSMIVDTSVKCRVSKNGVVVKDDGKLALDIYPFYNCPKSKSGLLFNIWRSHILKILVGGVPANHGNAAKLLAKSVLAAYPGKRREKEIEKLQKQLCYTGPSDEIADYYGLDVKACSAITYNKEWFGTPKEILFEDRMFYAPANAHAYLTKRYGDYMTPVSKKERDNEMKLELIKERD